jgi:hypothetical protein
MHRDMNTPVIRFALALTALLCAGLHAAQTAQAATIYRCTVNGRTVYQQSACASAEQEAARLEPGAAPNAVKATATASAPVATPAAAASVPTSNPSPGTAPATVAGSLGPTATPGQLDAEAARCLAYLKPLLRDPTSATVSAPQRDGRVLRLTVNANDGRGRMQQRDAACEFVNGRVDDSWTQIQLKRLGWLGSKPVVLGDSREARRLRAALESDIEVVPKAR